MLSFFFYSFGIVAFFDITAFCCEEIKIIQNIQVCRLLNKDNTFLGDAKLHITS